jgi:selenocysteine lyase/cysteine desulfurase
MTASGTPPADVPAAAAGTIGPRLDVAALRRHFPQLADGTAYFDGPGGTQTPDVVADAVREVLLAPLSNRGTATPAARNAESAVVAARSALGDLLGMPPSTVVLGRSATELTFVLRRTLARSWGPGDEVVVTRLDHDANVRPWVLAAEAVGATVRWVPFDRTTGELRTEDVAAELGPRTRLVAVTGASNLLGTRPDLPAVAALAHEAGALVHVDGVHLTAHAPSTSRRRGRTPSPARRTSSSGPTSAS